MGLNSPWQVTFHKCHYCNFQGNPLLCTYDSRKQEHAINPQTGTWLYLEKREGLQEAEKLDESSTRDAWICHRAKK